jgi:putative ABC transport system ATP-binding protein
MSADEPLFRFDAVSVVYDDVVALDDVCAEVPADGITAIIGPSGAGKSTLLRLCNRLEVPTHGRVLHHGRDLAELDPLKLRRSVGMVFQKPALFGGTVDDNLAVAVEESTREERTQALELAAIGGTYLDRPADTLSGGEAQRVCLARTLLTGPHALLLDEPTSALDERPKRDFEDTARDLAHQGIPILWVTHEPDQVKRVADRVLHLRDGRLAPHRHATPLEDHDPHENTATDERDDA